MCLLIIGGHDCMSCRYRTICEQRGHRAKVYTQMPTGFCKHIGSPDRIILFTSTVSHKMVEAAVQEAKRKNIPVIRSHTSSKSALQNILASIENSP